MKSLVKALSAVSLLLLLFAASKAAPIAYSGKVAINGVNFQGTAKFAFELRDANGTVHWRNGADANASIEVHVDRGRYVVLLGGQGMTPAAPRLFLDEPELYLKVRVDLSDGNGMRHLAPDQRITSTPHALSAEVANLAKAVDPGAVTRAMLAGDVLADFNVTDSFPSGEGRTTNSLKDYLENGAVFNVKDYGADSTGETNSTVAIQNAINSAENASGGIVLLPIGTYVVTSTIILPSKVTLQGMGHATTTIKLADGANVDVIQSKGFTELTGQNKWFTSDGVAHGFSLRNFRINGNKANNSSGNGISIYGKRYFINKVVIHDCAGVGLYSECGDIGGQNDWTDLPECFIGEIFTKTCGSHGIHYRGPHDGTIQRAIIAGNGGNGLKVESNDNVYNGSLYGGYFHIYASKLNGLDISSRFKAEFVTSESNYQRGVWVRDEDKAVINFLETYKNDRQSKESGTPEFWNVELASPTIIGIWRHHESDDWDSKGGLYVTGSHCQIGSAVVQGYESNGSGVKVDANGFHFSGRIKDYSGSGGIGLYTNPSDGNSMQIITAGISDCKIGWKREKPGHRNIFNITSWARSQQTALIASPHHDGTELWNVVAYDSVNLTSRASGQATIAGAETSVTVTHGLTATPRSGDIHLTFHGNPGNCSKLWISEITSTQFTINVDSEPGSNIAIAWMAHL